MALAANIVHRDKMGSQWCNIVDFTFSGTYPTGGEAITPQMCGFGNTIHMLRGATDGTHQAVYDSSTAKLLLKGITNSSVLVFLKSAMTDNTDATGFIDMPTIPDNAVVLNWSILTLVAFSGDTSAVAQVGIAGDLDRFSAHTTGSVFTTGLIGSAPLAADVMDGFGSGAGTITPRITITSATDFTNVAGTGSAIATLSYRLPDMRLSEHPNVGVNASPATIRALCIGV